jgi:proteasome lid subunit RPN8/RPN11
MNPDSARPVFPIFVKDAAFRPPEASTYYLLTADGLYLTRATELFAASVPAEGGVPGLQAHTSVLTLRFPRLPRVLFEQAMGFFRAVCARWQGEGILLMFYAPAQRRFALRAPRQYLCGRVEHGRFRADLHLDYEACERPGPEYLKLGTFHSHADVGPRHSGLDVHDEWDEPGLHITAGYVHSSRPEFAAAFVVGRTRFTVAPSDVLPPFRATRQPPDDWIKQVVIVENRWPSYHYAAPVAWQPAPYAPPRSGIRDAKAGTVMPAVNGTDDEDSAS